MNTLKRFFTFNFHDIQWKHFTTYDFWFGYDRSAMHTSDKIILIVAGLMVLAGIISLIYAAFTKNEFLVKIARWKAKILITIGLLEAFWFVLRYQYVQVFGTHFVAALILVIGLIWLYHPTKYFLTRYKTDLAEAERKANREKYLNRK